MTRKSLFFRTTILLGLGLYSSAALAQDELTDPDTQDWLVVGGGVISAPTYSGSDDNTMVIGGAVIGRVAGFRVSPRVAGVAVDLIRDDANNTDFTFGPVVRARFDRTSSHLKDPVVSSLGKLDTAVEVGANVGVGFDKVLHQYDRIDVSLDVRWDVASAHKGMVVTPSVAYQTPLSRGTALQLAASADYWNDKTSRYYWSVSPAQTTASGLPTFTAKDGFNSVALLGMGIIDLDGNLLNGGVSIFVGGGYQRLTGSASDTPITRLQGKADQFFGGIGIGYTFF